MALLVFAFSRSAPAETAASEPLEAIPAHMLVLLGASAVALEKGWGVIHPFSDAISGDNSDYVMISSG